VNSPALSKAEHAQLEFVSNIRQYVDFVYKTVTPNRNSSQVLSGRLPSGIPFLGPRFLPMPPPHAAKRSTETVPVTAYYLRPTTTVHPLYSKDLQICPGCRSRGETSTKTLWKSWSSSGRPRHIHGLFEEEMAIGMKLHCETCAERAKDSSERDASGYCSTTNYKFWEGVAPSLIPGTLTCVNLLISHILMSSPLGWIPHFMSRSAVTRELYDLICEMRLQSTSGGLQKSIKRMLF
jgi:hypothetical protein